MTWRRTFRCSSNVQVHHYTFRDGVFKDSVHHGLEGGRAVSQTKKHNEQFIKPSISSECSFPFISFLHANIVETQADIQFGEVPSSL